MKVNFFVLWILFNSIIIKADAQSIFKVSKDSLCITDLQSGLMWMKNDYSGLKKGFLKCWDSIFIFKTEMNEIKYGGYNDWYVPSIAEYRSINASKKQRLVYKTFFSEIDSACVWGNGAYSFWASNEKSKYVASYISFIDGFATSGDKCDKKAGGEWEGIEFGFSVRLVRRKIKNK